jgi:outer membrane protein TolC
VAYWEVRQLGVGERVVQREARSKITQARMREIAMMDRIAREVHESRAQVTSRRKQIAMSREAVEAAEDSFARNWDRIRNGKGLPIEALQAIQALANAQSEYIRAVSDFNVAQFTLQHSLGWPIRVTSE